jgi:3-hydroxyacyl-[acyl-carrier-protein] dehydratase
MRFDLVDRILEQSQDRIITLKHVTAAEEYLQDHFPSFPVLPGVMMLEALVQAGQRLLATRHPGPLALGRVRALKFGRFVKPGATLRVEVTLHKEEAGTFDLKGEATLLDPQGGEPGVAASGRFTLRPLIVSNGTAEPSVT